MTNNNNQDNKDLHRAYLAFSRLMKEFNLNLDNIFKTLREYYVREVYKSSKTVTRTALRCAVDRRIVSQILKNKKPYRRPSKIPIILQQIKFIAKRNNGIVNKIGKNSVESIMNKVASGATTVNSIIKELLAMKCIKDCGGSIQYLSSNTENQSQQSTNLQKFSEHLDRYVNTLISNMHRSGQQKRDFNNTTLSTKIPKELSDDLSDEAQVLLAEVAYKLMLSYESQEGDIREGTYPEMGITLFQFDLNLEKQ